MGLVLMGGVMISKSLIQISVDGWSCVPSLLFTFVQAMVEVMKIMATSINMSHACTATVSAPSPAARDTWTLMGKSGAVSCGITAPFSWVLECTRFCLCLPIVCFPVLRKFGQLYGGLNGDLLQEGLCHTQVCCTQSPCP